MKAEFIAEEDFVVGQKVGRLTITSIRPFKQVCECGGKTSWTRAALRKSGVRSCGCGFRVKSYHAKEGDIVGLIYKVIERVTDKQWRVQCTLCQQERTMNVATIHHCRHRKCPSCVSSQ